MNRPSPLSPNGAVKPAPNSRAGNHSACLPAGRGFFGGIIGTLTERVALLLPGSASTRAGGGPRPQTSLGPLPAQAMGPHYCASLAELDDGPTSAQRTGCTVVTAPNSAASYAGGVFPNDTSYLTPPAIDARNPATSVSPSSGDFGKSLFSDRLQGLTGCARPLAHKRATSEAGRGASPYLSTFPCLPLSEPVSNPPKIARYDESNLWADTTGAGRT